MFGDLATSVSEPVVLRSPISAWIPIVVPRRRLAMISCAGPGGGGGGGQSGASGTARGGGGGGQSGTIYTLTVVCAVLPCTLYCYVGGGGAGGVAGASGSAGEDTMVAFQPSTDVVDLLVMAHSGNGGSPGAGGTGGAGGIGANITPLTQCPGMNLGFWSAITSGSGNTGLAGGTATNGAGATAFNNRTHGGGGPGGAGMNTSNTSFQSGGNNPGTVTSTGYQSANLAGGTNQPGSNAHRSVISGCGTGVLSTNGVTPDAIDSIGFCCGGTGGGSGTTGGKGGRGGPGLITIVWY